MSKRKIIVLSVILGLITLNAMLFGVVFRLRNQKVVVTNSAEIDVSANDIIKTANLKNGVSIFMLDKQAATKRIEAEYPKLKVVQIKTVNLVSVEICVRSRVEMFYCEFEGQFYLLDEDLKLLEIVDVEPDLIKIDFDLNIKTETKICDFVGTNSERKLTYNFVWGMLRAVKKSAGDEYIDRADIKEMIATFNLVNGYSLNQSYKRMVLETDYGVVIDIAKPENDIENKLNKCFSALNSLTDEQKQAGTLKLTYNDSNVEVFGYIN